MNQTEEQYYSNAHFSKDRNHRYVLIRKWDASKPSVMIIGLNPSTADAQNNDPTIRRCIGFAKRWGFGSLYVCNLFSYRATKPEDLFKFHEPIGPGNKKWIKKLQKEVDKVVLAYGNHGLKLNGHEEILKLIKDPYCIKKSKYNIPLHPLYLKYTDEPIAF